MVLRKKVSPLKSVMLCLCVILSFSGCNAQTSLLLPSLFGDNMVLQQKSNTSIWGQASPGKTIIVNTTWSKTAYTTKVDKAGKWRVVIATPGYGGPYRIDISDGGKISLNNVMIGEVWLCSGQSNMTMPLAGWGMIKNYKSEINAAKYPNIRFLTVNQVSANQPVPDTRLSTTGWQPCNAETVANFSSTAYFFARELYLKTGIPIGLIHSSWEGTICEAWTSGTTLTKLSDFTEATKKIEQAPEDKEGLIYKKQFKAWQNSVLQKDSGYRDGKPVWASLAHNDAAWDSMKVPGYWELQRLKDFDGIVWLRKTIEIPSSWSGKEIKVNLGTIDDADVTFYDGKKIGESEGVNVTRIYKIPANEVRSGKHVLTVRVFDSGGGGGIYGDKSPHTLTSSTGGTILLDGNWKYKVGLNLKDVPLAPTPNDGPNRPTVLYNAMIHPLINYTIKGVIWYQGESNVYRAYQYRELFPAMIADWRKKWNIGNFPFYFVQVANYLEVEKQPQASAWAELREAQSKVLTLPNTGMAVAIDIGERADIHPKNKQEVGRRLGLIALAKNYGFKSSYSGPVMESFEILGDKVNMNFKFAGKGLKTKDGKALTGFAIAGSDHQFFWATAFIQGDNVILSSKDVENPVAVRYGWANNPVCNLYNSDGLPASPFRTDEWQGITFGNK